MKASSQLLRRFGRILTALLGLALWHPISFAQANGGGRTTFDLPVGAAAETLKQFGKQAGREIVFAVEAIEAVTTNAVKGEYTAREALDLMLEGTGLIASQDAKSGAFAVRRDPRANSKKNNGLFADETLLLSPFEVNAQQVIGTGESRATFTVDRARLEERPAGTDITVALKSIPGLQVSTGDARGGSFSWELYLRGLNKEQIGFSLDGIPTGDARFNGGQPPDRFIDASNLARIVVSKSSGEIGSPSRFALGGFVNFITEDPAEEFRAAVDAGFGSFDYRYFGGRVDLGEFASGTTAYASYSHRETGNHAGPKSRSGERDHFEAKLVKVFGDRSRVAIRASYNDLRDNDYNIVTLQEFRDNPRSDRAGDEITGVPALDIDYGGALGGTREDWLVYANLDLQATDRFRLSLNPYVHSLRGESYRYQDRNRRLNDPNPRAVTSYNALGGAVRPAVITTRNHTVFGGPADMRVTPRNRDRHGVTGEILMEEIGGIHTVRLGAWHEKDKANELRNFFPLLDSRRSMDYNRSALAYVEYERTSKLDTTMFHAQDRVTLLEGRLNLDLGVTYIDTGYDVVSPLEYNTRVEISQDSGLLPKFGAYFRVTDSLEIFGGAARNFSGLPEDVFLGSSAVIRQGDLNPMKTDNFDIGVRFVSRNFALSVQGYHVDLDNTIGIVPLAPGTAEVDDIIRGNAATRAANLAGIKNSGVEVTAFLKRGDFDLYAAYAHQEAKHKSAPDAASRLALALNGVIAGERVRDVPEDSVSVTLGWEPAETFRLAATVDHVGRRAGGHIIAPPNATPANAFDKQGNPLTASQAIEVETIPGRTLVGLSCRYRPRQFEGLSLELNVDNLFNEAYIGTVSSATVTLAEFGVIGGNGYTLDRYFIGYPRTFTFSIRAAF